MFDSNKTRRLIKVLAVLVLASHGAAAWAVKSDSGRPNILLAIADDMSARHLGCYGDPVIQTPAIDRLARQGVLFRRAFCAAPSCAPSRSAILTGQAIWRLEEGGILFGTLPNKFAVFPRVLESAGYFVGFTGKGWGPGNLRAGGWKRDPLGRVYEDLNTVIQRLRDEQGPEFMQNLPGIFPIDYAKAFEQFLADRPDDRPFLFWYGAFEPHLPWPQGRAVGAGRPPERARVPESLPDHPIVREDILDYGLEVEHFDAHLNRMLETLEAAGETDNTIVIVTGDHGIPLPRAKSNLYDLGTHVPLVVRWPAKIPGARRVDDLVSLADLAPTILEAAGLPVLPEMTGRSLMTQWESDRGGQIDPRRDAVFIGFERHLWCRANGVGYPMRAVRTREYLYIRNLAPDRWPAGDPDMALPRQGRFGDSDGCRTKQLIVSGEADETIGRYFRLAFGRRPAEELYDVANDPDQVRNLADDPAYAPVKRSLAERLAAHLAATEDPRSSGKALWDRYPFFYGDLWKQATEGEAVVRWRKILEAARR